MVKTDLSTEEKILDAAREVFHRDGYHATRMEEIAKTAGMNKALVHYYYRSKDRLFERIFQEAAMKFIPRLVDILNAEELTLEVKISRIVDFYYSFLIENREIPVFVLSEIRQSPERIFGIFDQAGFNLDGLKKNIEKEVAEGDIRSIDPAQFFIHLLGLTVFPFIMEPMVRHIFEMDEPRFSAFLKERRKEIPRLMMCYLKPDQ